MSPLTETYRYAHAQELVLCFGDFKVAIPVAEGDTPREVVSKLRRAALVIEEEAREGCVW